MPELRALTRERELRGYSKLRKAELIAFLQDNENLAQRQQRPPQSAPPKGASTTTPTEAHSATLTDVYLGTKSTSTDVYLGTGT